MSESSPNTRASELAVIVGVGTRLLLCWLPAFGAYVLAYTWHVTSPERRILYIIEGVLPLLSAGAITLQLYTSWKSEFTWRVPVAIVLSALLGLTSGSLLQNPIAVLYIGIPSFLVLSVGARRRGWPKVYGLTGKPIN